MFTRQSRIGVSIVLTLLTLVVCLAGTVLRFRNDRDIYRLLLTLEHTHKAAIQARLDAMTIFVWISMSNVSNSTLPPSERTAQLGDEDDAVSPLLVATYDLQRAFRRAIDRNTRLNDARRQHKRFVSATKALAASVRQRQPFRLHEALRLDEAKGYDQQYDTFLLKLEHIRHSLHRAAKVAVFASSVFLLLLLMLWLGYRLRAWNNADTGKVSVAATQMLKHEFRVPSFIIGVDLLILDANQAAVSVLGVQREALLGKAITDFVHYNDQYSGHAAVARKAHLIHQPSGKVVHFVAHTIQLMQVDGSERFTIVCHNVSSSYELEIQKKVSNSLRACRPLFKQPAPACTGAVAVLS